MRSSVSGAGNYCGRRSHVTRSLAQREDSQLLCLDSEFED